MVDVAVYIGPGCPNSCNNQGICISGECRFVRIYDYTHYISSVFSYVNFAEWIWHLFLTAIYR